MRGKAIQRRPSALEMGITPACAGKRLALLAAAGFQKDHPRVCGEKSKAEPSCSSAQGSPPRVRGKVFEAAPNVIQERITPACAGKSKGQLDFPIYFEDHPRVCGEKSGSLTVARAITGSPPRVRGKELFAII